MAFLDYDGLSRFWGKVKDYIASHSGGRGNSAVFHGVCSSLGSAAEKVVTCPEYDELVDGDRIYVQFGVTNTSAANSLTLNVNGTGAKPIRQRDTNYINIISDKNALSAGSYCLFTYDGGYWILTAPSTAYVKNVSSDGTTRPFILGNKMDGASGYSTQNLTQDYKVYYSSAGSMYVNNSKVLTEGSDYFNQFLQKIDAVDVRHDQYLYGLESNEYRVVLRIFFVDINGNILQRNPNIEDEYFLNDKSYSVSIKAYNAANNVIETYHNNVWLHWEPTGWHDWYTLDSDGIYPTRYWLELTTKFVPPLGLHHIAVSFENLDSDLYMYNQNQDLTFNIASLSHDTVEIKNVGLVYANGLNNTNGGYYGTGYKLPDETVNVPQIWSSSLEEAELVRGYSYAFKPYNQDDVDTYWISLHPDDESDKIIDKLVVHNGRFFYTTGYFEMPITMAVWQGGNY